MSKDGFMHEAAEKVANAKEEGREKAMAHNKNRKRGKANPDKTAELYEAFKAKGKKSK